MRTDPKTLADQGYKVVEIPSVAKMLTRAIRGKGTPLHLARETFEKGRAVQKRTPFPDGGSDLPIGRY